MSTVRATNLTSDLQRLTIREVLDLYPSVMPVLAHHGMDTCCGSGRTIPEAAGLHGLDADAVLQQVIEQVEASGIRKQG